MAKINELTDQQQLFVDEYLIDINGTQAAIRAGYAPKNADVKASKLLRIAKVRAAVDKALAERSKRTGVNQDRVIQELAKIAFADMGTFVSWDKNGITLTKSDTLSRDDTAAVSEISEVEIDNGGFTKKSTKIKLHSKESALEKLGKHLGMFKDEINIGDININIIDNIPKK